MEKILVPMDFSKEAINALEVAVGLAHRSDATIILPHIIEIPGHFYHSTGKIKGTGPEKEYAEQLMTHFNERLGKIKEELNLGDVKMEHQIEIGSTYPNLKDMVAHSKADLVVMGSKGINALEELLLGSTTLRMIRHSKCPVLTIKNKVDLDSIKTIVFTTSGSPTPLYVTDQIQLLAKVLQADLKILRVNTKAEWKTHREIENEIKAFIDRHHIENYEIEIYDDETAVEGIIHYSEDRKADLLAVMTHGRTGLSHLVSGSVAEKIASYSKLPVWTCSFDHLR